MMHRKILSKSKAISPIFATLILIAIAVIAGVVVYMFTSGALATMTAGGTAATEKVTVQSAYVSSSTLNVILEQTAGPAATVNGLIIKNASGNTITTISPPTGGFTGASPLTLGSLTTISGAVTIGTGSGDLTAGSTYTVTVTTAAGGSFVSPTFPG